MLCDKCVYKSFCKHYDYIVNTHCLTIELKECNNYKSKTKQELEDLAIKTMPNNPNSWTGGKISSDHTSQKPSTTIANNSNDNIALLNKQYPDLKEIIDTQMKPVISDISAVETKTAICDRCKREVNAIELDNCIECGRPVCNECGVSTLNDIGMPETTCEKCWSGTPDPDPNDSKKVSITYGEEDPNQGWNLESFIDNKETENIEKVEEEIKDESTRKTKQVDNKRLTKKSKAK